MKKIKYLLGIAIFASVELCNAQGIFSVEELYRSTQSTGMGGVSIVNNANAFSVYENSSAVALSEIKTEFGLQYSPWAKTLTKGMDRDNMMINAGGYYSLNSKHKLLAGISFFLPGGNKMYRVDGEGNITGDEIRSKYVSVNLGYAYRIKENLGASVGVSYANWNDGFNDNVGFISLDLGLTNRFELKSNKRFIDIAFRINGWGYTTEHKNYKSPGFISIGAMFNSKDLDKHLFRIGTMLECRCLDSPGLRFSLGGEYGFNDIIFVRGGYNIDNKYRKENSFGSLGLGTKIFDRFQLDLTYLLANRESQLKNTYLVGFAITL